MGVHEVPPLRRDAKAPVDVTSARKIRAPVLLVAFWRTLLLSVHDSSDMSPKAAPQVTRLREQR